MRLYITTWTIQTITRAMNFGEFRDGKAQQPLPPTLAPHEAEIGHFASLCNQTCTQIMSLLALGLEVSNPGYTPTHFNKP